METPAVMKPIFFSAILFLFVFSCSKSSTSPTTNKPPTKIWYGDTLFGGIVFDIDSTGKHGLVAALHDGSGLIEWWNLNSPDSFFVAGTSEEMGTGAHNTDLIIAAFAGRGLDHYPAKMCRQMNDGGYTDWYLPSIRELGRMYLYQQAIGSFDTLGVDYWSSSQWDSHLAWVKLFDGVNGGREMGKQCSGSGKFRAIRSF